MIRLPAIIALITLVSWGTAASAADDPIGEKLIAAKATYDEAFTKYRKTVLDILDEREAKARAKGIKVEVDRLKGETQAFIDRGAIPLNIPGAVTSTMAMARSKMEAAYRLAIKDYTKAKQDELAGKVRAEFDDWLEATKPPKPKPVPAPMPAEPKKPYVIATWMHKAGTGKGPGKPMKLYSNGHINSPDGPATWTRKGSTLTLRWPAPKAPGGAWDDVCQVTSDGKRYSGRNEKGVQITGTKLGDGDVKVKD